MQVRSMCSKDDGSLITGIIREVPIHNRVQTTALYKLYAYRIGFGFNYLIIIVPGEGRLIYCTCFTYPEYVSMGQ